MNRVTRHFSHLYIFPKHNILFVFQRTLYIFFSLLLVLLWLPILMFSELYPYVNQTLAKTSILFGTIVGLYHFFHVYKKATAVRVIFVELKSADRLIEKKGENENV